MKQTFKILYVDDEFSQREALRRTMRNSPFTLVTAASGVEALKLASKNNFDVAIVDILMPDMDGLVLLSALRKIKPDLPVIMLTGITIDDAVIRSVQLGCEGFLEKPYEWKDLEVQINSVIAKRYKIGAKK